MSEKLERVKDFGELREGMIVEIRPCHTQRMRHRGMLCRPATRRYVVEDQVCELRSFDLLPAATCSSGRDCTATEYTVAGGRLWRVVDGLESPQTTERAKERVR